MAFPSATTPQPLDYSCTGPQQTTESGVTNAIPENPFNDISVQEQPLGSSNGIAQLEDQGAHGAGATSGGVPINVANNESYARSSRALSSSDLQGLNFVAYAQDGVTWFHYTKTTPTTTTPSNGVTNLSVAQLQGIWNGTITNWDAVGGANAKIVVFVGPGGLGHPEHVEDVARLRPLGGRPTRSTATCLPAALRPASARRSSSRTRTPRSSLRPSPRLAGRLREQQPVLGQDEDGHHGADQEGRHLLLLVRQVRGPVQGGCHRLRRVAAARASRTRWVRSTASPPLRRRSSRARSRSIASCTTCTRTARTRTS